MKKALIISPESAKITKYFKETFEIIKTEPTNSEISYEQFHADMQILKINDTVFVDSNCKYLIKALKNRVEHLILCDGIGTKYPDNVSLNAALVGNNLICKETSLHPKVKEYCSDRNIRIINVNQGYTKCSTLILNENTIITDDESIFKLSLINNISVLKIEKGDILLDKLTYGFIGGASLVYNNNVYIFGDINKHRNAKAICDIINKNGLNIVSVTNESIKDIGGAVII